MIRGFTNPLEKLVWRQKKRVVLLMEQLPFEITLLILNYLEPDEILTLLRLNKKWNDRIDARETWNYLFFKRFKKDYRADDPKLEYRRLDRLSRFKGARELSIAWSNDEQNWRLEDSVDAQGGSFAFLRLVFWMHIIAEFKSVSSGIYEPIIRLCIPRRFLLSGSATKFLIDSITDGIHIEVELMELQNQLEFEQFVELKLPIITVTRASTITVQIKETDNQRPKQGLILDCIQLRRVCGTIERPIPPTGLYSIPYFLSRMIFG
jgi:hypothetical protein